MGIQLAEHIWLTPEKHNYIMLDVTGRIPPQFSLVVDGVELFPKEEYHISLVAADKITATPEESQLLVSEIAKFLRANPKGIYFEGLTKERYICRDGDEVTMIAPANIAGLNKLYGIILRYVSDYRPAVPHVTLLKSESSIYGIGIHSEADFRTLCTKYPN